MRVIVYTKRGKATRIEVQTGKLDNVSLNNGVFEFSKPSPLMRHGVERPAPPIEIMSYPVDGPLDGVTKKVKLA